MQGHGFALTGLLVMVALAGCLTNAPEPNEQPEPEAPIYEGPPPPKSLDAQQPPQANAAEAWTEALGIDCSGCYEPTLAVWNDTLLLTTGNHEELFRRLVDGTWEAVPGPSDPEGGEHQGDVFIQVDDEDRLWWTSLNNLEVGITRPTVLVAMSPDGGDTWPLVHSLRWLPAEQEGPTATDRQWLAVEGDTVVVACTCPVVALPQIRVSTDGGQTFGEPMPIPQGGARPGPLGPLALQGSLLQAAHLVGAGAHPSGSATARHVAVLSSDDLGQTWGRTELGQLSTDAPVCCAFPNMVADDDGFKVAWTRAGQGVTQAHFASGWQLDEDWGDGLTAYPHAWPVADAPAVVWAGRELGENKLHVTIEGDDARSDTVIGLPYGQVGDYVHGILWRGHVVTAWPVQDGARIGFVPL